jgi:hypothetical protein
MANPLQKPSLETARITGIIIPAAQHEVKGYPDASPRGMTMRSFSIASEISSHTVVFRAATVSALFLFSLATSLTAAAEPPHTRTLLYEIIREPEAKFTPAEKMLENVNDRLQSVKNARVESRLEKPNQIAVKISVTDPKKLPEVTKNVERLLAYLSGQVEFRILANRHDHQALIKQVDKDPNKDRLLDKHGELLAWWVPLAPGIDPKPYQNDKDILIHQRKLGKGKITEILVVPDPYDVTDKYIHSARPDVDPKGNHGVSLTFDDKGVILFGKLTGDSSSDAKTNFRRRLGILIDGNLFCAPYIPNRIIYQALITGNFTQSEVNYLCKVLNSGSHLMRLKKVGEK